MWGVRTARGVRSAHSSQRVGLKVRYPLIRRCRYSRPADRSRYDLGTLLEPSVRSNTTPPVPLLTGSGVPIGASAGTVAHAGQHSLGVAASFRDFVTVGCLSLHGSHGYVAGPPALSTTGVARRVRIDLLFGANTFPTWPEWHGTARPRRLHYLATYPHQLTLPSPYPAYPQDSSLHRLLVWRAWLLGASCGLRLQVALEAHLALALGCLERVSARPLHGQRAAVSYSYPHSSSPPVDSWKRGQHGAVWIAGWDHVYKFVRCAQITSSHKVPCADHFFTHRSLFLVTAVSARRLPDLSLQPSDAEDTKAATQKSGCAAVSAP